MGLIKKKISSLSSGVHPRATQNHIWFYDVERDPSDA